MQQGNSEISRLRTEIDALDNNILNLLFERATIVREVGKLKEKSTAENMSFIRPAREASMVRSLSDKAKHGFPPAAVASMWRMIISASLSLEKPMHIKAYSSETNDACYWMAREYFGVTMPLTRETDANTLIEQVANDGAVVGVLPLLDNNESPWWLRPSSEKNHVYIFAQLPFLHAEWMQENPSLVIANVMPEPSDDDWSVVAVKTTSRVNDILQAFAHHHTKPELLAAASHGALIAIKGFLSPHSSFAAIENDLAKPCEIRLLGAFAAPIEI